LLDTFASIYLIIEENTYLLPKDQVLISLPSFYLFLFTNRNFRVGYCFLFCCVFDSVLKQFSHYFAGVDSKDCCCLFQRTALSHPKCLHSSTPTHLNVREDHVVILMRLFSYLELRHPLLPQVRTHTGDPCIQILHSSMLGAVITRDTQRISFNSPFKISELP